MNKNKVFIATSLDGYIADKNGKIDWLHEIPNPDQVDMGYANFMEGIDAIVMGRNTFETVDGFGMEWPYKKPVFVLSNTLQTLDFKYNGKVALVKGSLPQIVDKLNRQGHHQLYIDGGSTIQGFLKNDLVDEMILTTIPILLGSGVPLFANLDQPLAFQCVGTKVFLESVVQNRFIRKRD